MSALPAGLLLFDTTVYIRASRSEKFQWLARDYPVFKRTLLSAVVAAELYAGTHGPREKRALDELCEAHRLVNHFVTPSADMWRLAGISTSRARRTFGQLGFAHHFRDGLIALEAARARATLVTEDVADFARWKSLIASTGKTLKLFNPA